MDANGNKPLEFARFHRKRFLAVSALLLSIGLSIIVLEISTTGVQKLLCPAKFDDVFTTGLFKLGALLVILALIIAGLTRSSDTTAPEKDASERVDGYNQALVGLGFALVLLGVLNFVALAGFAAIGEMDLILQSKQPMNPDIPPATGAPEIPKNDCVSGNDEPLEAEDVQSMVRLFLLPGFALLGSLFFVAGSVRRKREELVKRLADENSGSGDHDKTDLGITDYNSAWLFAGLWYRMGEAVLFALVIFLFVQSGFIEIKAEHDKVWVLLMALLMGMFIKPAEHMINGIALKLFEGIRTMFK